MQEQLNLLIPKSKPVICEIDQVLAKYYVTVKYS